MLYGKGFSRSNLMYVRKLYIVFPIGQTVSDQLENKSTASIGGTASDQLKKIQTMFGKFSGTLSHRLSWSHYVQILTAENE